MALPTECRSHRGYVIEHYSLEGAGLYRECLEHWVAIDPGGEHCFVAYSPEEAVAAIDARIDGAPS
jgi:hypothetical protein